MFVEGASLHQRDLQCFKEPGRHIVKRGAGLLAFRQRPLQNVERDAPVVVGQRHLPGARRPTHSGQGAQLGQQFGIKPVLLVGVIARLRQIEIRGEHVFRIEAEIHVGQPIHAADQQSRANEQHHTDGGLSNHQS